MSHTDSPPSTATRLRVLRLMSHLGTGGTEKQCLEVLAQLRDRADELNLDVHLATFCGPPFHHVLPIPAGVSWHRIDQPWTPLGALQAARKLRLLARDYDCVHALLWPAIWVARLARLPVPIVASIHNTTQPVGRLGLKRRLDTAFIRGTGALVFNSEAGRRALGDALGPGHQEVSVVPNGKTPIEESGAERSGIVCVSRISPQKRQDLLLQALSLAGAELGCGARFVGQGTDVPPFSGAVAALGRSDVVGVGEVTDAMPEIAGAQVLALPTDHEGLPNVILEAWNARTPVVASRVSGVSDLIRNGTDGILVDNTAQAWADGLRRVLADEPLRARLVEAGRARLEQDFSLSAAARGWADVYRTAARPR